MAPLRVSAARYSRAQLKNAAAAVEARFGGPDGPIHAIRIAVDGSEIRAVTDAVKLPVIEAPELALPVTVERGERAIFLSRLDDSPPWWGGAKMRNRNSVPFGYRCSTGFAIDLISGSSYMLTAAHCVTSNDVIEDGARTPGNGDLLGRGFRESVRYDVATITTNGNVTGRIYDSRGTIETSKAVHSSGDVFAGESLCQSGAQSGAEAGTLSGTVCNLITTGFITASQTITDSDGDRVTVIDLIEAKKSGIAARPGDSGGPVFSLDGDGVRAKGIVSARGGLPTGVMYFQDIRTARQQLGFTIKTQ
jgi:hypothetical protein